jgi:hypothetical protein
MKAINISKKSDLTFQWFKVGQTWDYTMYYCFHFSKRQNYLKFVHKTPMFSYSSEYIKLRAQ